MTRSAIFVCFLPASRGIRRTGAIRGRAVTNTENDAAVTWQFGPREWSYQRAGWTSYKDQYLMFPGKHRWLLVNGNNAFAGKGSINFSATWQQRAMKTAADGWNTPNTSTATPQ